MATHWGSNLRNLTDSVSVLVGEQNGTYPSGNSLVVKGKSETVIIDPSVTVVAMGGAPVPIDAVINSHEDHTAGNEMYANARLHVHENDLPGVRSLDGMLDQYGLRGRNRSDFRQQLIDEFSFTGRPDANGFRDGHRFDLGGTTVEAVHLPGHTSGHSGFRISGGVFFLSDIDLTGFGPYYGDVWSDLDQFEESLIRVRGEEAEYYVTFHHKGVLKGRPAFLGMLDQFHSAIGRRHQAMLEFLTDPHSVADMVQHRFIYRPHVQHAFADGVEQRSAQLHLKRMLNRGEAHEIEPGRYLRS